MGAAARPAGPCRARALALGGASAVAPGRGDGHSGESRAAGRDATGPLGAQAPPSRASGRVSPRGGERAAPGRRGAGGGLERRSTSDSVCEILLDRILDGVYPPGERIVELEVARELGTSQAPVREALRELQGLRLVEVRPYRGARVREITDEEMRESLQDRGVLEAFAARTAGGRMDGRVAALRRALERMRAAADAADCDAFVHADVDFHREIVEAADRGALLHVWSSVGVEARIRMLLKRSGAALRPVADAHEPILEALARGDGETAAVLLADHGGGVERLAASGSD